MCLPIRVLWKNRVPTRTVPIAAGNPSWGKGHCLFWVTSSSHEMTAVLNTDRAITAVFPKPPGHILPISLRVQDRLSNFLLHAAVNCRGDSNALDIPVKEGS